MIRFITHLAKLLEAYALSLGVFGVGAIAFLDSSFLSFPEINDILIIANSFHNARRMLLFSTSTLIGSILGCALLFYVGKKGGRALLRKRFDAGKVARVSGWYQKFGILAVIIPSLLPPPTPFKLFVISAGVFEISWPRFLLAITVGRGIRYYLEGYLALQLGQHAGDWMRQHYLTVALSLVISVLAIFAVYLLLRKKKPAV
ncbi:MAG: VTT domain-containing protein [Acidobacteriia bacterium]|nr:VTT domain-containing protein [Terriglobia bacterium]